MKTVDVDKYELVSLQHSGYIPVPIPAQSQSGFKREDYNAPTTRFDPVKQQGQQPADIRSKPGKSASSDKRRGLLPLLSAITAILLLAVIGTGYYTYQAVTATSVNVNISPQAHVINEVYTIKVDPTIQKADTSYNVHSCQTIKQQRTKLNDGTNYGAGELHFWFL